jgi:N6-L-threonylcarbamoyladenine synthase
MQNHFYTLGIETSCDETAVAVLAGETDICCNLVYSQAKLHARYGGVVPEVASRNHLRKLPYLVREALAEAEISIDKISLVASTYGPGLIGPLLVGLSQGKATAFGLGVPFIGINHLEGHIFAHRLSHAAATPPFMALIVSGGHTCLILAKEYGSYQPIGATVDDAAGEALDKVGKMLGLDYPAGAALDQLARRGNPESIPFPKPMESSAGFDFSFAGLKTSVRYYLNGHPDEKQEDVAASFMRSLTEVLVKKSIEATRRYRLSRLIVVGGVAANSQLQERILDAGQSRKIEVFFPPQALCTDNAAMIAAAGAFHHLNKQESHQLSLAPAPALSL